MISYVFSFDVCPNEVTTLCSGQEGSRSYGFPSGLIWLWEFGTSNRLIENSLVISHQAVGLSIRTNMCEISHMFAGGKRPWSRKEGTFIFSASVQIFKKKKINKSQGML